MSSKEATRFNVRFRIYIILTLLLGPTIPTVFAQNTLTLEEAIGIALEKNYAIRISEKRIKIAENDNSLGNAGFLPSVTASSQKNYTSSHLRQEFFNALQDPIDRSGVNNNNSNSGVSLNWTIFDGLGMFVAQDRLEELERAGRTNAKITIENTVADISSAYYEIIRQYQRVRALRNALDISNDRLELAKAFYEVGTGSKVDFINAQVDYNGDTAAYIAQEQTLRNAKIDLNALLAREATQDFEVSDTTITRRDISIDDLRQSLLAQNPNLVFAAQQRRLAELDIKALSAQQYPQVDLLGGFAYTTSNNQAGFGLKKGRNDIWSYGARVSVNVFDGFNQRRRIQNAKINSLIVEDQESDIRNQLLAAFDRSVLSYRNSLQLVALEEANTKLARQNVEIAFERYRVGNSTSYEFREVQRNTVAAETRLIEAEYNAKLAEIELLRLSGGVLGERSL
ncbi:TolC family protein [Persicitalea jodogahamensis]|uniref:Membrane protein n=1 Tax=Persicitalea jodogahamensis TaxID=402147 RepID=A0A8J3D9X0_9BACT|nr:TolC family protein [Persicitalea jodogahamensis]GHB73502.1 membrane protein [Persicitalea jodogahamensis]